MLLDTASWRLHHKWRVTFCEAVSLLLNTREYSLVKDLVASKESILSLEPCTVQHMDWGSWGYKNKSQIEMPTSVSKCSVSFYFHLEYFCAKTHLGQQTKKCISTIPSTNSSSHHPQKISYFRLDKCILTTPLIHLNSLHWIFTPPLANVPSSLSQ